MFTVEQIKAAHSKVKSGADFPAYVQEIKALGVTQYETYVTDGHTDYYGVNGFTAKTPAKYAAVVVANQVSSDRFKTELKEHQQGKTDFLTFIHMCATMGVEKWIVSMSDMTCVYYDKSGSEILLEKIPQ